MYGKKTLLQRFSLGDLTVMALCAALGLGTKPLVTPLIHLITAPLFIPGGTLAGGIYMVWILAGASLVSKWGSATIICLVQAIVVMSLGFFGSHGLVSLLTYTAPGLAIDVVFALAGKGAATPLAFVLAGICGNVAGTFSVNLVFFRLPGLALLLMLSTAAFAGGLGGLLAMRLQRFAAAFIGNGR